MTTREKLVAVCGCCFALFVAGSMASGAVTINTVSETGRISAWYKKPGAPWARISLDLTGLTTRRLVLANPQSGGNDMYVATSDGIRRVYATGGGIALASQEVGAAVERLSRDSIACGDSDNENISDLVVGTLNTIDKFTWNGSSWVFTRIKDMTGGNVMGVAIGDTDADGVNEVAGALTNLDAGAKTGLASVFNGLFVMITLLFLTPLLYYLPQAVLAAIIIMAVTGLFNFSAIKHAWLTHRHDGAAAIVTFVATLTLAPHLDRGILIGAGLALVLYLLRTMKPRVAILGRHADGTLRDARVHNLPTSEHIVAVRFDGSLYFANVPYFEEAILEAVADKPKAKYVLIMGDSINQLDASGEEVIRHLVERLHTSGVTMVFSGLKKQVLDIMQTTGLYGEISAENFFRTEDLAIETLHERIGDASFDARYCPLRKT